MSAPDPPDVERLRAALARLGEDPDWPEADSDRLFSTLHGEMSAEERRQVVDELIRNPRAAAAWRLARELEPNEQAPARAGGGPAWRWIAAAALVVIAAGVAWQFGPGTSDVPIYRGADPRQIESALPEEATLSRSDAVLRWTQLAGARYRVRVFTPDLDLIDEREDLTEPEYRLDAEVLRAVPAGGRILWQVEATVRGTSPIVSPTFSAVIE